MKSASPEGSQSIGRAVELLSAVAARGEAGARLTEVAGATKLHFATARRILQALVASGLLAFDPLTKRYVTGPQIFALAVQSSSWFSRRELFMPALAEIARRTRDTVMLSMRSGDEAVCLERCEGDYPIRVMSLDRGTRRPLGAGAGSLAILSFLGDEERAVIIPRLAPRYKDFNLTAAIVDEDVAATRRAGYSRNAGRILEGIHGVGVPILSDGVVAGAISVAAIESRMGRARIQEIVAAIRAELARVPGVDVATSARRGGKVA